MILYFATANRRSTCTSFCFGFVLHGIAVRIPLGFMSDYLLSITASPVNWCDGASDVRTHCGLGTATVSANDSAI